MSDDVFFTQYVVPDETPQLKLKKLFKFLAGSRSIANYHFNARKGSISIIVASRFSSLKYSDCPLPGTHDFAAGWLAHEAMLTVSKYLGASLAWYEAEFHRDSGQLELRNRHKPPVIIDWYAYISDITSEESGARTSSV